MKTGAALALMSQQVMFPLFMFTKILYCNQGELRWVLLRCVGWFVCCSLLYRNIAASNWILNKLSDIYAF